MDTHTRTLTTALTRTLTNPRRPCCSSWPPPTLTPTPNPSPLTLYLTRWRCCVSWPPPAWRGRKRRPWGAPQAPSRPPSGRRTPSAAPHRGRPPSAAGRAGAAPGCGARGLFRFTRELAGWLATLHTDYCYVHAHAHCARSVVTNVVHVRRYEGVTTSGAPRTVPRRMRKQRRCAVFCYEGLSLGRC